MALRATTEGEAQDAPSRRGERALVRAAQAGSPEAFGELFAIHWARAHRAAFLIVHDSAAAEDITQEAFLAALRALHRFDRRRPFGPWLTRIVINRAIDWTRIRNLRRESGSQDLLDYDAPAGDVGQGEPYSETVASALAELTLDQRAVVVLRYLLEYTPGEIATMLELPRGTVNSRLRRALDTLGLTLGDERP